jgi:hypothetical protein
VSSLISLFNTLEFSLKRSLFHLQYPKKIKYLGVNLRKDVNYLCKRITNPWRKRSRKTTEAVKICHAHGW